MKVLFTTLFLAVAFSPVFSQSLDFTLANPQPQIHDVYSGSIISADLDNDGDMDIVQSGIGEDMMGFSATIAVFINDGIGNFTLSEQDFSDFWSTERAYVADLDNDEDLDIIVTALNRTDFYRNDGQANFSLETNSPLQPSNGGDIAIGDIDGDGDEDIIQHGQIELDEAFTALYLNDGSGNFTEVTQTVFQPFIVPATEFIDLENDGDLDLITFGNDITDVNLVKLYENDGNGNFSSIDTGNLEAHSTEDVDVADIDNDGDMDILVSGFNESSVVKTTLYLNDGNGAFSELMDSPFADVFTNSNNITDLDNDGDLDVLIVGSADGGIPNIFAIVYENLGNNNFVAADSLGGEYIPANTIADFNGDGKKDIIIQGFVDDTNVYWNTTTISNLEEISETNISLFPNPSNGFFQIQWEEMAQFNLVEIFDLSGKKIFTESLNLQNKKAIEIDALPGIYSIRLSGERSSVSRAIVLMD